MATDNLLGAYRPDDQCAGCGQLADEFGLEQNTNKGNQLISRQRLAETHLLPIVCRDRTLNDGYRLFGTFAIDASSTMEPYAGFAQMFGANWKEGFAVFVASNLGKGFAHFAMMCHAVQLVRGETARDSIAHFVDMAETE